ncbi:hypothetical protein FRC06_009408, partial [Ceratobasidium sp. 370]
METLQQMDSLWHWFLKTLVGKVKMEMESGPSSMWFALGPTLELHKDSYVQRIAGMLIKNHPSMSVDRAVNEALWIAESEGTFTDDLVSWDQSSGQ